MRQPRDTPCVMPSLSKKERLVADLLNQHGSLCGADLVKHSGGSLVRGTVYVMLDRLEDKLVVESRIEERSTVRAGIAPRRFYKLTTRGQRLLDALVLAEQRFARAMGGKL